MATGRLVVGKGVVEWIAKRTGEFNCFGTDVGIGWLRGGEIVAGVAYANWNGVNVECHIAGTGKHWLTRQYLWTIFDYPFNQLGAKRITVCVGEGNHASIRFVKHLGFILEARLKGAHHTGDILIFCMRRHSCRFIQKGFHREKLAA